VAHARIRAVDLSRTSTAPGVVLALNGTDLLQLLPPVPEGQGQGMETIFSQVVADVWQVAPEDVVLSFADTAAIAIGFGTMASRSTVTLRRLFIMPALACEIRSF
jgi:xanthine dehydrogenase molybdopterin-binding subunit B